MRVTVRTLYGETYSVDCSPSIAIDQLQDLILKKIPAITKASQRLIHNGHLLETPKNTLESVGIKDEDVIIIRQARTKQPDVLNTTPIPTARTILAATALNSSEDGSSSPSAIKNMKYDPAFIVGESPLAKEKEDEEAALDLINKLLRVDQIALQHLVDMGFEKLPATKALIFNRMNTQAAMDWLLQHGEDEDINDPITGEELQELIEEEKSFEPNMEILNQLKQMGFSEEDATQALRATNNDEMQATQWLLGDRGDMGLDEEL
eukprot:TRINITY_DN9058_c0_g1_i1.p1 TRINITY_DN9058_c0_g1~~TRINITY_DN9058_c0_g1_i1.p1  ORF type:complete len:264 (+),score=61.50 TRINITY_DN9058_c0_g1_i1:100-891(+)